MGHVLLGELPDTKRWKPILQYLNIGAGVEQITSSVVNSAKNGLKDAAHDLGVQEVFWLLVRLPFAAQEPNFAEALRGIGIDTPSYPALLDITLGLQEAIDSRVGCQNDLTEMATSSAVESIITTIREEAKSLFGSGPEEVQRAFAKLATKTQFGRFARHFLATFSFKCLNDVLSRVLPLATGEGKRFPNVHSMNKFNDDLKQHCFEASKIVEDFAGDWFSKYGYQTAKQITREQSNGFLHYAIVTKLSGEFSRREVRNGD